MEPPRWLQGQSSPDPDILVPWRISPLTASEAEPDQVEVEEQVWLWVTHRIRAPYTSLWATTDDDSDGKEEEQPHAPQEEGKGNLWQAENHGYNTSRHVPHVTCHTGSRCWGLMVQKVHRLCLPSLGAFTLS